MGKRVLLVGSSFSAAPIFFALKSHGFTVGVAGTLTDDPCHVYADFSCYIDYSDKELLLAVVREHEVDYLCPTCNDYSYLSCAWVAQECGFPGYDSFETTQILHSKEKFRKFCVDAKLPVPKATHVSGHTSTKFVETNFPLLVKPVDSFSGRGITKVHNNLELSSALEHAIQCSRSSEVLVEEFVDGSLHSHSAFIQDGEIVFDVFADEYCSVYPYQVDCSNIPSKLSRGVQTAIRRCISDLINALQLNDGLLHTQILVDGNDFWLVECMRRAPGDLYYHMVELSTKVNGMDFYVRPFVDMKIPVVGDIQEYAFIARHTISVAQPVVVQSFSIDLPTSNRIEVVPLKAAGEVLSAAPYDKMGIFFACFDSRSALFEEAPRLTNAVSLQTLEIN